MKKEKLTINFSYDDPCCVATFLFNEEEFGLKILNDEEKFSGDDTINQNYLDKLVMKLIEANVNLYSFIKVYGLESLTANGGINHSMIDQKFRDFKNNLIWDRNFTI